MGYRSVYYFRFTGKRVKEFVAELKSNLPTYEENIQQVIGAVLKNHTTHLKRNTLTFGEEWVKCFEWWDNMLDILDTMRQKYDLSMAVVRCGEDFTDTQEIHEPYINEYSHELYITRKIILEDDVIDNYSVNYN